MDHTKDFVRSDYVAWLRWLRRQVKADGFRLDFVVGFGAEYLAEYLDKTKPQLAVGEYWDSCGYEADGSLSYNQDFHRDRTVAWIHSTGARAAAFDFTTKGILQEAMSKNQRWRLSDPKVCRLGAPLPAPTPSLLLPLQILHLTERYTEREPHPPPRPTPPPPPPPLGNIRTYSPRAGPQE